jgi:hypothetical protein
MKERNKCNLCKKKVTLYGIICKCKNLYCYKCLDSDIHKCIFDYKLENQNILRKKMESITEKIIHI